MSENENEINNSARHIGSMKKLILFNNIRMRLLDQLCFLDIKTESNSYLINELSDFFRNRGQLELEHSRNIDKILQCFQLTHNEPVPKNSKKKPIFAAYACWHHLISETQSLSYDYATLSEIYNVSIILKLQKLLQIYKKYHELVHETHDEILRVLRNFFTTIKTYHIFQDEYKNADTRKNNSLEKQQSNKVDKLDALRARNIFKHYKETSNAAIHKSMLRDLSDIIYGTDSGFCLMVSKAILAHVTSGQKHYQTKLNSLDDPFQELQTMNAQMHRKKLSDKSIENFTSFKSSPSRDYLTEEKNEHCIQNILDFEFELQMQILRHKEDLLRKKLEKIYGILDMVETSSKENMKPDKKADTLSVEVKPKSTAVPVKHGKLYILANLSPVAKQITFKNCTPQKIKLDSKGKITHANDSIHGSSKHTPHRPKLFGGSLEEYLRVTNEPIPLIMRSCIRVIKLFGLHSHGIFRVSGSQVEILNFRDSFERGEDPLAGATDASDMNSVAGVLKLFLRELKEPLFPSKYFDIFLSLIQMESKYEVVSGMRNFFHNLPKSVVIVIRYLFAFLSHLSEYASENMMDAFNLAVSFGPTLMPAPEDKKQLQYQTQLNELIKVLIVYHHEVFPKDLGGPLYEKSLTEESSV